MIIRIPVLSMSPGESEGVDVRNGLEQSKREWEGLLLLQVTPSGDELLHQDMCADVPQLLSLIWRNPLQKAKIQFLSQVSQHLGLEQPAFTLLITGTAPLNLLITGMDPKACSAHLH